MNEPVAPPGSAPAPRSTGAPPRSVPAGTALIAVGLVYLAAGIVLGIVFLTGGVTSSLFPTGWILPVVLMITGGLMATRRRFDVVMALWGALTLAVFLLDMDIYLRGLDLRLEDPAAFDPTIITAALAFIPLLLRPRFRS